MPGFFQVEITGCLLPTELQTGKARFVNEVPDYDGLGDSLATVLCSVEELALSHYKYVFVKHFDEPFA